MTAAEIRQSFFDFFRERQHSIVPSASLLPDSPNLLFTNAGMNQFVPIFLGQQRPSWNPPRVVDTQTCIRAGGKHNDLDDVGLDTYHHTFFEMLGNWSFGDYFKKEAIEWAWELVAERWKLPPSRLYATVYKPGPNEPSEFDQEAHDHWARLFEKAGLNPAVHVVNGNKKDNFWMMGDTGPCGPCSELHVDLTPAGDTKGSLVNAGDARCIEIWNLVFIQFNANADGTFSPLPQRHVDTGMGLERITAMIQGTKNFSDFTGIISNYETDVFRPIFDELEKLSGKKYTSTLPPAPGSAGVSPSQAFRDAISSESSSRRDTATNDRDGRAPQIAIDIAFRVIADHIRTLSFAIADGIQPSNEGRGYVLRRILRRAVRYGRTLGFHEPFFYRLVDVLTHTMGDVFGELPEKQNLIKDTLRREEEGFNKTLDKGIALFEAEVARLANSSDAGAISGTFAFRLYDEQGFPFDLTELMARERGLTVDNEGFESLMNEQRSRARAAQKKTAIELSQGDGDSVTNFLGYDRDQIAADVIAVTSTNGNAAVVLNNSVCYAEMGGQVGDRGAIQGKGGEWKITNTQKSGSAFVHLLESEQAPEPGEHVTVMVDAPRRRAIEGHHTVTHVLHWALHQKVSSEATQKGSYVGPDKLTFDFSSAALTPQQKRDVEKVVNEKIAENAPVSWKEIPYAEAKKRSDIQQFFGDKYGDIVRVLEAGPSIELCGGTHVKRTGDIGLINGVTDSGVAAGVRRLEALTGRLARKAADKQVQTAKAAAAELKVPLEDMPARIVLLLDERKKLERELTDARKKLAMGGGGKAAGEASDMRSVGDVKLLARAVSGIELKDLRSLADEGKRQVGSGVVAIVGLSADGKAGLVVGVTADLTSRFNAVDLVKKGAEVLGGKGGGGRPDMAQAGGPDGSKAEDALKAIEAALSGG